MIPRPLLVKTLLLGIVAMVYAIWNNNKNISKNKKKYPTLRWQNILKNQIIFFFQIKKKLYPTLQWHSPFLVHPAVSELLAPDWPAAPPGTGSVVFFWPCTLGRSVCSAPALPSHRYEKAYDPACPSSHYAPAPSSGESGNRV